MPLEIVTIPCLKDNYAFLAHDKATGQTAVVDVPEAAPIVAALKQRGWTLSHVLLTHHHWDHVDGLAALLADHPATVIGAAADAHRLPPLDIAVREGDRITIGSDTGRVIDVSGHTLGHIAFHFPDSAVVFTADSLMALGCGRLFEGTPAQMYESLSKLAALPPETLVCSGHEYTASNAKFALTIEPGNAALISRVEKIETARAQGRPTVPSLLSTERATNPFLRSDSPEIQANLGLSGADPVTVFTEVRRRKDSF
ncbi:MAG: hydroxyacylglutathione hydrolase [Rhodobacterales bacterium]|nr:hydroxyacylglutathione hydrolase [Rhodobacterales bacterium]MDX5391437.1 hydroxyacylglutathione hydrolase [Rhodobacterales bacterium]MDX5491137.1 hydroxyacylglutathione hydrolase [Rhodobacterales bacterium]